LHIPIGFGKAMTRSLGVLEKADALTEDNLVLADECSLWKTELYFAVGQDKEGQRERVAASEGAQVETLSGTFRTQVFDGHYKEAESWRKQMSETLAAEGQTAQTIYAFYTTCPRCAKAYGHNYVVLLARV